MGSRRKVVSGTVRDSLHMVDVIFGLDGGELPEIIVSDTGSYSDLVFGLLHLLGISYRPALADLPDQKVWRIRPERRLRPAEHLRPRQDRPAQDPPKLGGHPRASSPRSTPAPSAPTTW